MPNADGGGGERWETVIKEGKEETAYRVARHQADYILLVVYK